MCVRVCVGWWPMKPHTGKNNPRGDNLNTMAPAGSHRLCAPAQNAMTRPLPNPLPRFLCWFTVDIRPCRPRGRHLGAAQPCLSYPRRQPPPVGFSGVPFSHRSPFRLTVTGDSCLLPPGPRRQESHLQCVSSPTLLPEAAPQTVALT